MFPYSSDMVKIITITSSVEEVFGLGEDNNIYKWNRTTGKWMLYDNM
jgi:hypothetical protein